MTKPPPADALAAVAPEPPAVVEANQPPPPPAPPLEAEGVVAEEDPLLPPPPPPEAEEEDAAPVVADADGAASIEGAEAGAGGVVLTDELRDRIVKQVEYYFSDENLPTDEFLMKFVKNKQGFGQAPTPKSKC